MIEINERGCYYLNTEFEYRIEEDSVEIIKYVGDHREIILPKTIDGKLVTAIGDYAFVNQRKIHKLIFHDGIKRIGNHSFYDCRGLNYVVFSDSIMQVGDGAFKNCDSLKRVELNLFTGSLLCIKSLLEESVQEMELWLNHHKNNKIERACLIFPRYLHNYVEFTQAKIINQETHGFGVHYRELLTDTKIDYKGYDELFLLVSHVEDIMLCCKIAMARILYPYQVSVSIYSMYVQYLRNHVSNWLPIVLEREGMEELQSLEVQEFYTLEVLQEAIQVAHVMDKLEFVTYFMTVKQRKFADVHKKFEF